MKRRIDDLKEMLTWKKRSLRFPNQLRTVPEESNMNKEAIHREMCRCSELYLSDG